jgi:hypothetical protein
MKRLPLSVLILVISAAVLGMWMSIEGLHLRLFGDTLTLFGAAGFFWQILEAVGIGAIHTAWPLITVGTAWIGAVSCVLIRLRGIDRFVLILGLISLLFLVSGTLLGGIVLICLWIPSTRAWLKGTGDVQD